jgi:hypothetical protein
LNCKLRPTPIIVATQLTEPYDIPVKQGSGIGVPEKKAIHGNVTDWLLTHYDGTQEIVQDKTFQALYEEIPS